MEKFIFELELKLHSKKVEIEVSSNAKTWLAEYGYDPIYGARPMRRLIQKEIENVLTDEVLFGRLVEGGKVLIDLEKNQLVFDYCEHAEA